VPLPLLALLVLAVLVAGYLLYGSYIARQYAIDDRNTTPAQRVNDGVDFIPTRPFYLLSQHFSAIAAAGPIAGPILACQGFGWLPCVLWIAFGVVFIGAVHDFSALLASVRHGAHSIAEIARNHLGRRAYLALTAFIWLALLYVIIAFTQITADSFVGKAEEFEGLSVAFNKGGAVAASSALYLLLALVMGLTDRYLKPPMWLQTIIFVPATLGCVWAGTKLDHLLNLPAQSWCALILAYCFAASLLPMWLLQQPRGYLGGFVLYLALAVGAFGVLFGGFSIQQPAISDQAWNSLNPLSALQLANPDAGIRLTDLVLPFLFVTIACGACSGFHGLICGGTTSKQVAKESHCQPVAFGAMLLEGFVALIALATILILTPAQAKGLPAARIYGDGLAVFLTTILGKDWLLFASTFGAMAFSTFVFDTLDVSTRLGRYLLTELYFQFRPATPRTPVITTADAPGAPTAHAAGPGIPRGGEARVVGLLAAGLTAGLPLLVLLLADPSAYRLFWTLFGTSNQLLAALTLLGITVWLRRSGKRSWYTLWPMLFVMTITLWALAIQIFVGARDIALGRWTTPTGEFNPGVLNAIVALALAALAGLFIVEALRALRQPPAGTSNPGAGMPPHPHTHHHAGHAHHPAAGQH
jgi:carbon starvation protein